LSTKAKLTETRKIEEKVPESPVKRRTVNKTKVIIHNNINKNDFNNLINKLLI